MYQSLSDSYEKNQYSFNKLQENYNKIEKSQTHKDDHVLLNRILEFIQTDKYLPLEANLKYFATDI